MFNCWLKQENWQRVSHFMDTLKLITLVGAGFLLFSGYFDIPHPFQIRVGKMDEGNINDF